MHLSFKQGFLDTMIKAAARGDYVDAALQRLRVSPRAMDQDLLMSVLFGRGDLSALRASTAANRLAKAAPRGVPGELVKHAPLQPFNHGEIAARIGIHNNPTNTAGVPVPRSDVGHLATNLHLLHRRVRHLRGL